MTRALLDIAGDGRADGRTVAGRMCHACIGGMSVEGAALSLLTATSHRETLSATDKTAATLEDLQFTLGEGACLEAASTGRPVLVPDVHDHGSTTRWPVFAAAVAEQTNARALFALPLRLGTINLGVLDLYRTTPGPLCSPELRDVAAAADVVTLLLLEAQMRGDAAGQHDVGGDRDGGDQEGGLWIDRAEVHQATGMILAQLDIPVQDAFVRLRAYAFAQRRPLGDVSRDVVARRLVFTDDMT